MKLLVSDFDGTIHFWPEGIYERDLEAIRNWQAKGNLFALATGRGWDEIVGFLPRFNLDYLIISGGGEIIGKKFYSIKRFSGPRSVLEVMFKYINEHDFPTAHIRGGGKEYWLGRSEDGLIHLPDEVQEFEGIDYENNGYPPETMIAEINALLGDRINAASNGGGCDITAGGVTKATAVDYLVRHLNIDRSDGITVGDGFNDATMIKAFNGVTIESAESSIKAISRAVYKNFVDLCEDNM